MSESVAFKHLNRQYIVTRYSADRVWLSSDCDYSLEEIREFHREPLGWRDSGTFWPLFHEAACEVLGKPDEHLMFLLEQVAL